MRLLPLCKRLMPLHQSGKSLPGLCLCLELEDVQLLVLRSMTFRRVGVSDPMLNLSLKWPRNLHSQQHVRQTLGEALHLSSFKERERLRSRMISQA